MSGTTGYGRFEGQWGPRARLAWDTIALKPTRGIPTWMINDMQWSHLEDFSGNPRGSYPADPARVYLEFQQKAVGACFVDQWIPDNPLSMKDQGYETAERSATTGAHEITCDGMVIDSPEAVVAHLERHVFPALEAGAACPATGPEADGAVRWLIGEEERTQAFLGTDLLKGPYGGFFDLPGFRYWQYGYENYFMAYALYPEVMERDFRLCAERAARNNRLAARAILEGGLPRLVRLDHDMADSRGTLADVRTLDRLWFPHFARAIRPFLDAGIRLIWHCDGNLMDMVPRLLECGLGGFQGFQYEDGMDYVKICNMKTREGDGLFIIGGVSVTTTLPHGTPQDVRDQMRWLVDHGPRTGLVLGGSSSVAPGVPVENIRALCDGFAYYREHGRG